jgi:hypothetical protein
MTRLSSAARSSITAPTLRRQIFAVVAGREGQCITVIEQLKQGLQLVVAVGTAADDVQEQVELGRRGQGEAGHGGSIARGGRRAHGAQC